jgi:hypothetical protein
MRMNSVSTPKSSDQPEEKESSRKKIINIWTSCSFCGKDFKFASYTIKGNVVSDIQVSIDGRQVALETKPFKRSKKAITSQGEDIVGFRCSTCEKARNEITLCNQQIMQPHIYPEDLTTEQIAENRKTLSVKLADAAISGMRNDFYKS